MKWSQLLLYISVSVFFLGISVPNYGNAAGPSLPNASHCDGTLVTTVLTEDCTGTQQFPANSPSFIISVDRTVLVGESYVTFFAEGGMRIVQDYPDTISQESFAGDGQPFGYVDLSNSFYDPIVDGIYHITWQLEDNTSGQIPVYVIDQKFYFEISDSVSPVASNGVPYTDWLTMSGAGMGLLSLIAFRRIV